MSNNQEQLSFYRKMAELQEKLRKSEEERAGLEAKFQVLVKNGRANDEARLAALRQKYLKFLDEDKRRKTRNERIMSALDKIEKHTAALTAKTERLRLLRRHFDAYMARTYPDWKDHIKLTSEPVQNIEATQPKVFIPPQPFTPPSKMKGVDSMTKESEHFKSLMREKFQVSTPMEFKPSPIPQYSDFEPQTEFNTSRDLLSVTLDDDDHILDEKENQNPTKPVSSEDEELIIKKLSRITSFEDENNDRPGTSMGVRHPMEQPTSSINIQPIEFAPEIYSDIDFEHPIRDDYVGKLENPEVSHPIRDYKPEYVSNDYDAPEPLYRPVAQNLAFHRSDLYQPQPHHLNYIHPEEEHVEPTRDYTPEKDESLQREIHDMVVEKQEKEDEISDANISSGENPNQYYTEGNGTIIEEEPAQIERENLEFENHYQEKDPGQYQKSNVELQHSQDKQEYHQYSEEYPHAEDRRPVQYSDHREVEDRSRMPQHSEEMPPETHYRGEMPPEHHLREQIPVEHAEYRENMPPEHQYKEQIPPKHQYREQIPADHVEYRENMPPEHQYREQIPADHVEYRENMPPEHQYREQIPEDHVEYRENMPPEHQHKEKMPPDHQYREQMAPEHQYMEQMPQEHQYRGEIPPKHQYREEIPPEHPQYREQFPPEHPQYREQLPPEHPQYREQLPPEHPQYREQLPPEHPQYREQVHQEHPQFIDQMPSDHQQYRGVPQDQIPPEHTQYRDQIPREHSQFRNEIPPEHQEYQNREHAEYREAIPPEHPQNMEHIPPEHQQYREEIPSEHQQFREQIPPEHQIPLENQQYRQEVHSEQMPSDQQPYIPPEHEQYQEQMPSEQYREHIPLERQYREQIPPEQYQEQALSEHQVYGEHIPQEHPQYQEQMPLEHQRYEEQNPLEHQQYREQIPAENQQYREQEYSQYSDHPQYSEQPEEYQQYADNTQEYPKENISQESQYRHTEEEYSEHRDSAPHHDEIVQPHEDPQPHEEQEHKDGMYGGVESSEETPDVPAGSAGFKEMELQPHPTVEPDVDTLAELDSSDMTATISEAKLHSEAAPASEASSEDTVEKQMAALVQQPAAPPATIVVPHAKPAPAQHAAKSPSSTSSNSSKTLNRTPSRSDSRPSSASSRSKPPSPAAKAGARFAAAAKKK